MRVLRVFSYIFCILSVACAHTQPIVIAHRGASGYLPEHSLSAVTAAHIMNADYIEQDVVMSKDNVPVVLHDIHLESVTDVEVKFPKRKRKDGRFYAIDFTLKELKTLELHERTKEDGSPVFKNRFPLQPTGMKIPTLQEEILLIKGLNRSRKKNTGLYVELKKPEFHKKHGLDIGEEVLKVLNDNGYLKASDKVFIQSFDDKALKSLKTKTSIKLVQLVGVNKWQESHLDYEKMMTEAGLKKVSTYAQVVGPYLGYFVDENARMKNQKLILLSKNLGMEVHVFTLRSDQLPKGFKSIQGLIEILKKLGVDGYFSDQPDM